MDRNNIIEPTNNLDQLEQDYSNWLRLPHKYRMLSNSECITQHGCTVYDYYLSIKNSILKYQDLDDADDCNIKFESLDEFSDMENYMGLLTISKNLQSSPQIVIIDPDINTIEELEDRYLSFHKLNHKFRIFSNDYSVQLWGYNVDQMYQKILSSIQTNQSELDINNLVKVEESSTIKSIKDAVDPIKNKQIHIAASCDSLLSMENSSIPVPDDVVPKNIYMNEVVSLDLYLNVSIPKAVPYFTFDEMQKYESKFAETNSTNYYSKLKSVIESGNNKDIIDYGWIPGVELNEKNMNLARNRQIKWFKENFINVYNLQSLKENQIQDKITDLEPIYLIYENPMKSIPDNSDTYTKIGVFSNLNDMNHIYTISDSICTIESLDNYSGYIEIIAFFVTKEHKLMIFKSLDNTDEKTLPKNNIFSFLYNSNDKIDRTNEKFIYTYTIATLLSIANITVSGEFITGNNSNGYFRLFKGEKDTLNIDNVEQIIKYIYEYPKDFIETNESKLDLID